MTRVDLLIVGAGPAGMAAAVAARRYDLQVMVIDDQPGPGGQIWRSVETASRRDEILGISYVEGRPVAEAFRASGVTYQPGAQLWRIEPGYRAYVSKDEQTEVVHADAIVLATGAQERPVPFPGWTLPGVLTVGAAQILLKTAGEIPANKVVIAGCGPLPLLYAVQLLRAGGKLAAYLDTTPAGQWRAAVRHFPGAVLASGDLMKGLGWMSALKRSGTPIVKVDDIEALGDDRLDAVRYRSRDGTTTTTECDTLLVHEGVVPNIHAALSLDCAVAWNDAQDSFGPVLDEWGESSKTGIFVAGDGAGIGGAKAARLRGELAAIKVAVDRSRVSANVAIETSRSLRHRLRRELAARPFLDAMFRPRPAVFDPLDSAFACRCEEVTAGEIRSLAKVGQPGPNQIKAATRSGMGPCQGRQCGYTVTRLLASSQNRSPAAVGYFNIRPPLKPVTLGELAALEGRVDP